MLKIGHLTKRLNKALKFLKFLNFKQRFKKNVYSLKQGFIKT